jgi:hypothetical protein
MKNINEDEMYCVSCDRILKRSELIDHQLSNHHIDNVKHFVHQMMDKTRKFKLKERKEKIIKLDEEEGSRG